MSKSFPPDIDELLAEFRELEDWDERYGFLLDLGRELPPLPPEKQTEANRVHGCMSTVWMIVEPGQSGASGEPSGIRIQADSDSLIVKGLIVVLLSFFQGKSAAEVMAADPAALFNQLGLNQHLSPNRRNGLHSMVGRIRESCVRQLAS